MAKFCKSCGADMFICQRCGDDLCSVRHSSQWSEGVGNICDVCTFPELKNAPIPEIVAEYCDKHHIKRIDCKDIAAAVAPYTGIPTEADYQEYETQGQENRL